MEFHIFIMSTMSVEMTQANLNKYNIDFKLDNSIIQTANWSRKGDIRVKLWIACQHPLSLELSKTLLQFMDVCCVWYHDKSALSCIKVRNGGRQHENIHDNIWLLATSVPRVRISHESKIERCYNQCGFERPFLYHPLDKSIEKIIETELTTQQKLYSF